MKHLLFLLLWMCLFCIYTYNLVIEIMEDQPLWRIALWVVYMIWSAYMVHDVNKTALNEEHYDAD